MTSLIDTPVPPAFRREDTAGIVRCVIYERISDDRAGDGHGVANQRGDLLKRAEARGFTVVREVCDNDIGVTRSIQDALKDGKHRPGWAEVLRLVDARAVDVVFCWKWDRALREPIDLEYLIPRFDAAGVRFAEADGIIDLGTESGRMAARILIAVAKAEQERKSARQKLANRGAAERGERKRGGQRSFGWTADRSAHVPAEAEAIREACRMILGGAFMSSVVKDWTAKAHAGVEGYRPPRAPFGPLRRRAWAFGAVRSILLDPANAGLSSYGGEIVAKGKWEGIVSEETQKAVAARLSDGPRSTPEGKERRAGRKLLGSLALCPCGSVVYGAKSSRGVPVYRCAAALEGNAKPGTHVSRGAADVDTYVAAVVIERLSRDDAGALLVKPDSGPDVGTLQEEAAAIRTNLDELAADRALGLISRAQMIAATKRGNTRLAKISDIIEAAGCEDVLAPLVTAENTAAAWEALDLARKRAVIDTLMTVTLRPVAKGKHRPFDPATVAIDWKREAAS